MQGRTLILGGLVFAAVFGGMLWYFQTRGFYRELPPEPLVIGGKTYAVAMWKGIDATSSPLKRRLCLRVSAETVARIGSEQPARTDGVPLTAPGWFDCFDARRIHMDLVAGRAALYLAGASPFKGVDDYVAVYPDGRAYLWRQLQPIYRQ